MSIKAIETHYKGYCFRSRLEARWAVFFDALKIGYNYEPEGFDLSDGTRYLPDFWLPNLYFRGERDPGVWFEVKGVPVERDLEVVDMFASSIGKPICLAYGNWFDQGTGNGDECDITHYFYKDDIFTVGVRSCWWDDSQLFMQCPVCHKIEINFLNKNSRSCDDCKVNRTIIYPSWDLHPAIIAARRARFEFGESG